ncbi:MarR family winged helix-turn-helix transcriptional regulator [Anianabacter salinae]|uniref:MarR family winged helix-turn-helix transcriptional regulator n=1 Tax=Anianabacter salinae TaxID=2851023 RepID=UPI00225E273D|nr:MarR family transcriptional regulator [Anianabacter salinae]MBV0911112.1 MarR family transcriptional regulator [Anianabacter salinae]
MTDVHDMPGHLIRRLHQISVAVFTEGMAAAQLDLTSVQFAALWTVARHPGIDQATLAGEIAYDRATIGGVVDRLEAKGLLARQVSDRDRRARVLTVTDNGRAVLERAHPAVVALQDDILAGLTAPERETLLDLLRKTTMAGNSRARAPRKPG